MRSFSRASTSRQRGFVLISAIVLAVLYIALMELLLLDSARELQEAQRFRARVVALNLAENGAELAAVNLVNTMGWTNSATNAEGDMTGTSQKDYSGRFTISGKGSSSGVVKVAATVEITGRIQGTHFTIEYTKHSQ